MLLGLASFSLIVLEWETNEKWILCSTQAPWNRMWIRESKIRYVILLLFFCFLTLQIKWVKTLMSLLTAQVTINSFFPTMSCINFYLINIENKKFPLQAKNSRKWLKIADISFEQIEGLHIWMVIEWKLVITTLEELEFSYCAIGEEFSFLIETMRVGGGQGGPWGSAPLGRRETWGEGGNRRGWHLLAEWGSGVKSPKSRLGLEKAPPNQATPGLLPHCPGSPRIIPTNIQAGVENY